MLQKFKDFLYLRTHYTDLGIKDYIKSVLRVFYCPASLFINQINDDKTLIEIGCGTGPITFLISGKFPEKYISGFDVDAHSISIANQANKSANLNFFSSKATSKDIQQYDGVILFDVLHHMTIEEQNKLICDIESVQRKGNRIYVKCLDSKPKAKVLFNNLTDYISTKSECHYIGMNLLIDKMISSGYEIEYKKRIKFSLWSHYIVVGRMK